MKPIENLMKTYRKPMKTYSKPMKTYRTPMRFVQAGGLGELSAGRLSRDTGWHRLDGFRQAPS